VPPELEGAFRAAEDVVARYFAEMRLDPTLGTIEISGERYVLVRAASLSVEFFTLVEELFGEGREREADEFARNILFDLAHAIGKSDAQKFATKMGVDDPIARLSAGPIHFSHTGWAFVDIDPASAPAPNEDYFLIFDHPYSFESDAWLRAGKPRRTPVCIMNAGYSSGWCEASFGMPLVATEVECRACGDARCRFIMAPPSRIEAHLEAHREATPPKGIGRDSIAIPDFFSRKRVEEELRRAHEDLEQRVELRTNELRESNDKLRREMVERARVEQQLRQTHKLEAIGRLAGGVAHDFNTLLGVILGNAGMLSRKLGGDTEARSLLDAIMEASSQAAGLTRQLLAFSRAGPRGGDVHDVNRLIEELTRLLGRVIGEDIELVKHLARDAGGVQLDRVYLEQVVMNLVVNARDAMPEGGKLVIETRRVTVDAALATELGGVEPGEYVVIAVSDGGVGMTEEVAARIFEPYFTTKEPSSGTGLGLSTVYGIVKSAGGGVLVRTSEGTGSTFAIHLPAAEAFGEPGDGSGPRETEVPRGETVLVVEDQPALRAIVARALRSGGYQVLEAATPTQALELASQSERTIQLLLTDVVMPVMSGPRLALRLLATRPDLHVLYMSGYSSDTASGQGVDLGSAAVLQKPFSMQALLDAVRSAIDER
jgi:signal transduction histidine kinase/ActR/RegA family two-component response regulator